MNLHQVLTGACNAGDHGFAVGSVEGFPFTAYAAGCDIVILSSTFERVQIIPGVCHGNIQVVCLDCSTDRGKIAVAYGCRVAIFEPTPTVHQNKTNSLDYCWVQTGSFQARSTVHNLSWNLEGTRLLSGGECIQMWHYVVGQKAVDTNNTINTSGVYFQIGGEDAEEDVVNWQCIWQCKTASPIFHLKFSPDGALFASAGKADRLVKVWYEYKPVSFPNKSFDMPNTMSSLSAATVDDVSYSFIYVAHPRAVTGLSWRKTSKFMPRGSVSNMLVTSCRDNICRLWVQTVLPDDGLVNMQQFDQSAGQNPKYRMNRHKHKFMVRLKHMKTCFHFRRRHGTQHIHHNGPLTVPIPSLPSTLSSHDFHSFGIQGTGVTPGFHFHLAASINAETDIPLVPSIRRRDSSKEPNFVLHWLNNKEMHFTLCAEQILQDLCQKAVVHEHPHGSATNEADYANADENHEMEDEDCNKDANVKKKIKKQKTKSVEHKPGLKSKSAENLDEQLALSPVSHVSSVQTSVSSSSISTDPSLGMTTPLGDTLDRRIEALLRDWHQNPDLLFSVHPVDGSFLVWLVEWLDEYTPGTYRQAQVSFSSRIPNALPLGDATTMSTSLTLYNCKSKLDLKTVLDIDSNKAADNNEKDTTAEEHGGSSHNVSSLSRTECESPFSNSIFMLSKHDNGTVNLWNLTFNEDTKFTQVLSVGHQARVCGHRFRVNDITCHPVLPLLLTTSHHNLPKTQSPVQPVMHNGVASIPEGQTFDQPACFDYSVGFDEQLMQIGFCSELILWRVDPVGPLCRSGGITELARINSPEICAFANVAWIPTLLPSTTLGSISNSPSACFIASDGVSLRVYQAVIDARTLLGELSSAERKKKFKDCMGSLSSSSSADIGIKSSSLEEKFLIISQQSTARPGCVIQLDSIADANHDWYNTQLLHVFQEQLITGERSGDDESSNLLEPTMSAIVDLRHMTVFEEPFYLVVIEKSKQLSVLHMWKIVIASQPVGQDFEEGLIYAPDSDIIQEGENSSCSSRSSTPDVGAHHAGSQSLASPVAITTTKVCVQTLPLPEDVEIVHAAPAAGHLSSSSIYPACLAPYLICTACSDSCVRFWRCSFTSASEEQGYQYKWVEWEMLAEKEGSSEIDLPGTLLNVSCAYSGRIACAYKHGKSFTRPQSENPSNRFVNLCVAIYECESTGGTEWALEDTIHLRNIGLPETKFNFDLRYIYDQSLLKRKKQSVNNLVRTLSHEEVNMSSTPKDGPDVDPFFSNLHGLVAVPSFSTLQTLRKTICEKGNQSLLTQKHLVQLDWVSTEDGSHVLTVGVGSKVLLFTAVGSDIAQANLKAMKESRSGNRPILKKASSMVVPLYNIEEVRWMKVRSVTLETADGLPPLPMQISWVRDGILVIGMDNEMHVYSQWKSPGSSDEPVTVAKPPDLDESIDNRTLTDLDLLSLVHESSHHRMISTKSLTHMSSANLVGGIDAKKKRELITKGIVNAECSSGIDIMPDYGLFEASRIACPVLPQYHPKQLMELLNFGKIPRVKAILSHVVNCLAGSDVMQPLERTRSRTTSGSTSSATPGGHQRSWSRSRTMSISVPTRISPMDPQDTQTQSAIVSEDVQLDYVEINAIPPLPLFTLLNADRETLIPSNLDADRTKGYSGLFDGVSGEPAESLDDILARGMVSYGASDQRHTTSMERQSLTVFGPRQARILTQILTHAHLPGLSSLDQMHLLALADTVATFNSEISDKFTLSTCKEGFTQNATEMTSMGSADALDDCGLRFLLAMRHQSYLLRCVPIFQRAQLQKQGMSPANIVWAFHSEAEDELMNMIPGVQRGNPKWSELKELGVAWWVRSNASLRKCIEKVAKSVFQAHNDPMDAALFYLAMKKKNVLWGLFRSVQDTRMAAFFQHNFNEDRWRKAALKNAFALLGKQRFEQAASFFLLAGALQDAIEVCLTKLDDLQLAMVVVRLHEGDMDSCPPSLRGMLYEQVLGCNMEGENFQLCDAHPDPFLRSMAYWLMKDYSSALGTLLQTEVGLNHPKAAEDDARWFHSSMANPNVFNFYLYLRTHPLLVRHQIAESVHSKKLKKGVALSGFCHGFGNPTSEEDGQVLLEDTITSLERRLYFTTAHAHFKAGCPALALEVLSRLPNKVVNTSISNSASTSVTSPVKSSTLDSAIKTGNLETQDICDLDWSTPLFMQNKVEEKLELDFDLSVTKIDGDSTTDEVHDSIEVLSNEGTPQLDIMAQQLKFIACLKIVMEELSTLATGFEVDGGQLRYQLYIWLEQEVDALREICNYGMPRGSTATNVNEGDKNATLVQMSVARPSECPTLHEILMADKLDFEAKLQRAERRKHWLKANQTLLRTLLTYCCLHGASGGGLASVRMELILLLQELHQEKTPRQLLSPLPFPTTLPLLSASVACHKTVVTDPIRHLQSMTHDILQTIVALVGPPIPGCINCGQVFILRDLSIALAACIYQSLCDSDSFSVKQSGYLSAGMEALASASVVYHNSHLMAGQARRRRFSSSEDDLQPTTSPNKWPGVTSLRALLSREKDEDAPKLTTLLCEAFVSVYMSLLVHSLATCEAHTLYRLVGQSFSEKRWATLFGGGAKRLLKVSMSGRKASLLPCSEKPEGGGLSETGLLNTLSKQRQRLHMKLFAQGTQPVPIKDDRPTYREKFIPPEISMVSCFMSKPATTDNQTEYDSSESVPSEDDEQEEDDYDSDDAFQRNTKQSNEACIEHSDPTSYSWCILRYAIVSLAQRYIQSFLNVAGMELQELPVASPLIHSVQRIFDHWLNVLKEVLDAHGGPPADYIPGCSIEKGRLPSHKYSAIQDPKNIPFKSRHRSVLPVRRLWHYLVRQEHTHEIFVRYIFSRKRFRPQPMLSAEDMSTTITENLNGEHAVADPIRIIHKDQDSISAFCISQTNIGVVTLATTKEMQELDISVLLEPPSWLEDECEYDLLNMSKGVETLPAAEYLVVQTAADRPMLAHLPATAAQPGSTASSAFSSPTGSVPSQFVGQTGRATTVFKGLNVPGAANPHFCQFILERSRHLMKPMMKHKIEGVRRISAHPLLPIYVSGSQDGSVRLWEWGHKDPLTMPRPPGAYAKVTRVRFNSQGNKFGVSDGDGNLSLWQVGVGSSASKAFFTVQCHTKQTSDFAFVASSSLIATAGHSSESRNVCLWDTLLPQKRALVHAFVCHDQGSSCVVYAPQHQFLITAGKKGFVNIFDVRQRQPRHRFQAHESAIKCLALDPAEEYFATGSADGDIKIWGLTVHTMFLSFPGEHVRNSFFRNLSTGVTQLHIDDNNRLFSCGADGSMKLRHLPERDLVLPYY